MSDPCECIFNYERMMRQLLSVLSDSQTECTDTDCLNSSSSILPVESGRGNMMLIAMIWGFLAMIMFFFRPYSMRNNSRETNTNEKPTSLLSNNNNNNNEPPEPDVN